MPSPLDRIRARFKQGVNPREAIEEDTRSINAVWRATFETNTDGATDLLRLMLASIQQGEFLVSTIQSDDWEAPVANYAATNYLSHGSRVMFDLSELSQENQREFYAFLTAANMLGRTSTHNLIRIPTGQLVEGKGFTIGAKGQLNPRKDKTSPHRGVNIAVGGEGNLTPDGQVITANGYCGHLFAYLPGYHQDMTELTECMLGLEQTAPHGLDSNSTVSGAQTETDQFGNKHSLTGTSDACTAVGSLYFSHPSFLNLFARTFNDLPPKKYGGMKVILTDQTWPEIKARVEAFRAKRIDETVLNEPPQTSQVYLFKTAAVQIPTQLVYDFEIRVEQLKEQIAGLILAHLDIMNTHGADPILEAKNDVLIEVMKALDVRDLNQLRALREHKLTRNKMHKTLLHIVQIAYDVVNEAAQKLKNEATPTVPIIEPVVHLGQLNEFEQTREQLRARIAELQLEYLARLRKNPGDRAAKIKALGLVQIGQALDNPDKTKAVEALEQLSNVEPLVEGIKKHRVKDIITDALLMFSKGLGHEHSQELKH